MAPHVAQPFTLQVIMDICGVPETDEATELVSTEPAGPAEWSRSAFVSGVRHVPIRYSFA